MQYAPVGAADAARGVKLKDLFQNVLVAARSLSAAHAILVAGLLVAAAILVAGPPSSSSYMPNPQGGIWVRASGKLYLCRAALEEPAPCIDMSTGATVLFTALEVAR